MNDLTRRLQRGVLSAARLQRELGVSPATLMRRVRAAGPEVMRIGRGRATQYAVRESWLGLTESRFPIIRITESGGAEASGELLTLAGGETAWLPAGVVQRGLPVPLTDMRPSGFLGRHFASRFSDLRLPPRLEDWSDHHILLALTRRGDDLPGDLMVGEESFARWQSTEVPACVRADYPSLAEAAMSGHPPGSSAGGERPKFGAFVEGRHVLVKFAARGRTGDVVARRWCDLLLLEALALDVIAGRGLAAAAAEIVETDTHVFLEVDRFDRVGPRGRRAVLSLAGLHDDLTDNWTRASIRLRDAGRLSVEDARRLRWLDAFGALTANTDRHQFNVVFYTDQPQPRLAPAFDQVAMFHAPSADGQVHEREYVVPAIPAVWLDVWNDARDAASEFWSRAGDESRLGDAMRRAATGHLRHLERFAKPRER